MSLIICWNVIFWFVLAGKKSRCNCMRFRWVYDWNNYCSQWGFLMKSMYGRDDHFDSEGNRSICTGVSNIIPSRSPRILLWSLDPLVWISQWSHTTTRGIPFKRSIGSPLRDQWAALQGEYDNSIGLFYSFVFRRCSANPCTKNSL